MSKQSTAKTANSKYMTMKVYGKRRLLVIMMAIFGTGLFGFLFNVDAFAGPKANWALLTMGIVAVFMMLIPKTEEWHYVPWQDGGQKCEKDTND